MARKTDAATSREYVAAYREKLRRYGFVTKQEFIHPDDWPEIQALIREKRKRRLVEAGATDVRDSGFATEIEMVVLRQLQVAPGGLYGSEIVHGSRGAIHFGHWTWLSKQLKDKGYVRTRADGATTTGPRMRYFLTSKGKQTLAATEAALAAQK